MARGGEFVFAGQPSSVNIPFFPASVWLYAIPYALSPDPQVATWFTSAVNLIAVIGTWALARQWGAWAGLVAALYLAASPFAVFYARNIWQPNLLAPLTLTWGWCAFLAATRQGRARSFGIAACVFLGAFVVQVHFAGSALLIGTLYLFLRLRWWRSLRPVLIGGGLALIAALPYVYYITIAAPEVLANYGGVVGGGASYSLDGLGNLIRLAIGWDWGYLGLGEADTFGRGALTAAIAAGLMAAGMVGLVKLLRDPTPSPSPNSGRGADPSRSFVPSPRLRGRGDLGVRGDTNTPLSPDRFLAELTLVWLIMSPLFFARHSTPVLIHYQLVALPALALVVGASTRLSRRLAPLIAAAMLALAAVWTAQIAQTRAGASETRPVNSALSSILRESRQAAYESEAPVLFFTHGDDPAIDGEVAVFKALLWERPHRIINGDVLLILPPHTATLLTTLAPFQAWEEIEAAGLALDVVEHPRREGALPFVATAYDGASDPAGFTAVDPVMFADGTTLEGWRVRRVGDRLRVSTLWRAVDPPADTTIQQFHHLRTADTAEGDPLMVSDVPLSIHTWQSGDRVVVMADFFDVPPGEGYTVDVGHYTLPDVSRIPITGSDQTHVRLGAFDVTVP